jgi:predicted nucleic acid-binding protein
VSLLDVLVPDATISHSQITDLYLLGLAAHNGGRLATLDSRINATAVRGGREALFVIPVG